MGVFAGQPAATAAAGLSHFFKAGSAAGGQIVRGRLGGRAASPRSARLALTTSASGHRVLFHGEIDNRRDLAAQLGLPSAQAQPAGDDRLYLAAWERWSDDCDLRIAGDYCALIETADGRSTRISRSPWRGPPLVFAHDGERTIVAAVPRVLFAAGVPEELDEDRFIANLVLLPDPQAGWYKGTSRIEIGHLAWLHRDGSSTLRAYYDHMARRETRLPRREDYVEAADALLREASAAALTGARNPGAFLSGGLDSTNVAVRAQDCLPDGQRLKSFTFRPHPAFREPQSGPYFGDDGPLVAELAAMHPRIEPHFAHAGDYDARWDDMFLAIGIAPYALQNMGLYHPILAQAQGEGCDVILDAEMGNATISTRGDWGYAEYLFGGRWRELYRAVRNLRPKPSSPWLGMFWHGIVPLLPDSWWMAYQRQQGRNPQVTNLAVASLRQDVVDGHDLLARLQQTRSLSMRSQYASRRQWQDIAIGRGSGEMGEIYQGFEQLYGLRIRDVTAYRPLVEFCIGLPTDLFLHDGMDRWLARALGKGLLPESIRNNTRYGLHNCDWHERIAPRRDDFAAGVAAARRDPLLGRILDFDRLDTLLARWPDQTDMSDDTIRDFAMALPRAAITARFVRYVRGSNG
ncbi:MAG: hypothetical protein KGL44_07655 [Sphingomonadales bacterium]|nr:hypothetical protein [Sphingomonadales bacterium]